MNIDEKRMSYNRQLLDRIAIELIKGGKDVRYDINGKMYILDIKEYEALLRFERPELFKDER